MKLSAFAVLFAVAFSALGVFADAANTLVMFSSTGPDKYSNGDAVADGEYYALVWTPEGQTFSGFTTDGAAADAAQKVIFKAPLAKGGCCPLTLFQVDSAKAPKGGVYSVYLLDTRASTEGSFVVTGSALTTTYNTASGNAQTTTVDPSKSVAGEHQTAVGTLVDRSGVAAPKITDFRIVESQVKITVGNIMPGFVYEVKGGLDKQGAVAGEPELQKDGTILFTVDKDEAKFFSVKVK